MTTAAGPAPRVQLPRNQAEDISEVEPYRRRFADLRREGESHRRHWREIEEHEFPRRGRWLAGDNDAAFESKPYSDRLLNNTPLSCRRTVASGLQNGLTPSSRDWFEIHPEDESLRDDADVTWYLSRLKKRAMQVLAASNFYSEVYGLYEDTPAFGISAMLMEDDDETVVNFLRLPVGSFWPETNAANQVVGLARRFAMSSEALAAEFGADGLPRRVARRLAEGRYYDRETVIQYIRPRDPRDGEAPDWARFECVYFLEQKDEGGDRLLARRYYRSRPFVVFRWSVDDGSPYGSRCPGMDALGDCKQLQALERKKLRAIDVSIDPPLAASRNLFGSLNRRPGTVTWVNGDTPGESVKPLLSVQYNINAVTAEIVNVENRIKTAHYNDFFLSILGVTKQMTAEEARQRNEEKTMVLGPIIERFNYDLLEHILNRLIDAIMFQGLAPEPPEQLEHVKYTFSGPLAMIQKAAKLGDVERWLGIGGYVAQLKQNTDALDRVDEDELMEVAARVLDVDEAILVPARKAQQRRAERAQAAGQAAGMERMLALAGGAKDLAAAKMGDGNALEAAAGAEGGA